MYELLRQLVVLARFALIIQPLSKLLIVIVSSWDVGIVAIVFCKHLDMGSFRPSYVNHEVPSIKTNRIKDTRMLPRELVVGLGSMVLGPWYRRARFSSINSKQHSLANAYSAAVPCKYYHYESHAAKPVFRK